MLERDLVKQIRHAIEERGGKAYKLHGSPYMQAGAPDLMGSLNGKPFALEVKAPGRGARVSRLQLRELEQWAAQGWAAGIVCSVRAALAALGVEE